MKAHFQIISRKGSESVVYSNEEVPSYIRYNGLDITETIEDPDEPIEEMKAFVESMCEIHSEYESGEVVFE